MRCAGWPSPWKTRKWVRWWCCPADRVVTSPEGSSTCATATAQCPVHERNSRVSLIFTEESQSECHLEKPHTAPSGFSLAPTPPLPFPASPHPSKELKDKGPKKAISENRRSKA